MAAPYRFGVSDNPSRHIQQLGFDSMAQHELLLAQKLVQPRKAFGG